MPRLIDFFSGLEGFSAAFKDSEKWDVVTVDWEPDFDPDIVANVLNLGPEDLPYADAILASPPCNAWSPGASHTHIDEDGRPVSEWGRTSILLVHHTRGLIRSLDPDWYAIENPMGGMRKELGHPDAHVWWCQYGSDRAKPTDLWGRLPPSFTPKSCHNSNPNCHHEPASRGSNTGTQSSDLDAPERAEIPYELSDALRISFENPDGVKSSAAEASW